MEEIQRLIDDACMRGDIDGAKRIFSENRSNITKSYASVFRMVIDLSKDEVVLALIENGEDINSRDESGHTPFIAASTNRSLAIISAMLEHGANINEKINRGTNALYEACGSNTIDVVRFLLDKGASIEETTIGGWNVIHECYHNKDPMIIDLLIERGADMNQRYGDDKLTPLHWFAMYGLTNHVERLIIHGADVNALDIRSENPIHYCMDWYPTSVDQIASCTKMLGMFIDGGIDINNKGRYDYTPLFLAVLYDATFVVSILMLAGASADQHTIEMARCELKRGGHDCDNEALRFVIDFISRRSQVECVASSQMPWNEESPLHYLGVCLYDIASLIIPGLP